MYKYLLLIFACLLSISSKAIVIEGKVQTEDESPVPYATLYVTELQFGILTDQYGTFQINLAQGSYHIEARSIGYQTAYQIIDVGDEHIDLVLTLPLKPVNLLEVEVTPTKEDPAYRIMRKAIAYAPYYLYQVSSYTATNYIKGTMRVDKMPKLLLNTIDRELKKEQKRARKKGESEPTSKELQSICALVGKLFVLESQSKITYKAPSSYKQEVIAYNSSIPEEFDLKGGLRANQASVYSPDFMGCVSPLSPEAFKYYRFTLADILQSESTFVHKIKITPKRKSRDLLSGYIYIIDGKWSVYSAEFSVSEIGVVVNYNINYKEIETNVYLPITYDMVVTIDMLGVVGNGRYYSSVKYQDIVLSQTPSPQQAVVESDNVTLLPEKSLSAKEQKMLEELDQLAKKEKFTTRDAIKMSRLMNQMSEPDTLKQSREEMEVKERERMQFVFDSAFVTRDSLFWQQARTVPLQVVEDSALRQPPDISSIVGVIANQNDSAVSVGVTRSSNALGTLGLTLLFGNNHRFGKSSAKYTVNYGGLLTGIVKTYNYVDGFWLGERFELSMTLPQMKLKIAPELYYATARKRAVWNVYSSLQYAPRLDGLWRFNIGQTSADIQTENGNSLFYNAFLSLVTAQNFIRFYQKQYVELSHAIDLANGLRLTVGAQYEKRHLPANYTDYHFWGKTPLPNYPDLSYKLAFKDHSSTAFMGDLAYTPKAKYKILKDGRKMYLNSHFPTFRVRYTKAIPLFSSTYQSDYDKLQFAVDQNIELSKFNRIKYSVSAGAFLTKRELYAPDYYYVSSNHLFLTTNQFDKTFSLLPNYTSSTGNWLEAHITWNSDYMLLSRIVLFQIIGIDEALHGNLFWDMNNGAPILEGGYSIGYRSVGRLGVFVQSKGLNFERVGLKMSIVLPTF